MEIHVKPEDKYDCHVCSQDVKQALGLTEHVNMHEKCDNDTCPHCQKDFTDKNKIGRHIEQIQAKERLYCNDWAENSTGRDRSSMRKREISSVKHLAQEERTYKEQARNSTHKWREDR